MPRRQFTEEQIIGILKQADAGMKTADRCREHGISEAPFDKGKAPCGGLPVRDAKRLRALEEENRKPKQLVATRALDLAALKGAGLKTLVTPKAKRTAHGRLRERFGLSTSRGCRLTGLSRSAVDSRPRSRPAAGPLRARRQALAERHKSGGLPMRHLVLRREGLVVNPKRTERLYRTWRLALPIRKRKTLGAVTRVPLPAATRPHQHGAMDFRQGVLWNHRRCRVWTILDTFTRECPMIVVDTSLTGGRIVRAVDEWARTRGVPAAITVDNGPAFAGLAMDQGAYQHRGKLDFIRPGKPTEHGDIESFNGKLRRECLSQHYFTSLEEAWRLIEAWRREYNQCRPHSAIGGLTPEAFAGHWQAVTTTNTPILS